MIETQNFAEFSFIEIQSVLAFFLTVAIKLECRPKHPRIQHESRIYERLRDKVGIPEIKWCGKDGDFQSLVMELLGPDLQQLLDFCSGRFKLKTVLMLADQILSRIECVHRQGIIQRDIKPENFAMYVHYITFL